MRMYIILYVHRCTDMQVGPPRVGEAAVAMECKLHSLVPLLKDSDGTKVGATLVIGILTLITLITLIIRISRIVWMILGEMTCMYVRMLGKIVMYHVNKHV